MHPFRKTQAAVVAAGTEASRTVSTAALVAAGAVVLLVAVLVGVLVASRAA